MKTPSGKTSTLLLGLVLLGGSILVSAASAALVSENPATPIRAYPNPWRADRSQDGLIRFDGFSGPATVKIYTISGEHVQTLHASSPVAWDLHNSSGESVASGVYLFLATPDGGSTFHGKLIIIK